MLSNLKYILVCFQPWTLLLQVVLCCKSLQRLFFVVNLIAFQAHHAIYAISKSELLATNPKNIRTVHLLHSNMVRMQQQRITNHLDQCKAIWDLVQCLPKMKETTLGTIQFNLKQNFRKKGYSQSYASCRP